MNVLVPQKLKKNDTIGILCVSGNIEDYSGIENAKSFFESQGYNVIVSDTTNNQNNYLCDTDVKRAEALNKFFKDDSIKAIIPARGGYGAIRILDKIDYEAIKNNPKIFGGYSDITALHLMIYKKTGLVTYNTPMAYTDFGCGVSEFSKKSFFDVLEREETEIKINNGTVYYQGISSGVFWGGNLSTVQSLCGLDFIPSRDFIFFAEDVNEPVYKIDRMFTQLLNISEFKKNIKGIVLGDFTGIDNKVYFDDFFDELAQSLKVPVISGLKFGHEKDKLTFPIGINVLFDTREKCILFK